MRFSVLLLLSAIALAFCVSFDGRKSIELSLLVGFVEILATEQFAAKFELSSLSLKKPLG